MSETKISVRSDLLKIAEDLKIIAETADQTGKSLGEATKKVGKNVNDQVAVVGGGMNKIRKMSSDLARAIGNDFKGLLSVNAIAGGLKLSEQFAGTVKQAVQLNDTIRNLAPVFGMTEARAEQFKRKLVQGLGEIGAGSDAAANALQGLAETPVRGEEALSKYAKTATELASITKQKGQEGQVAKGLSGVVVAQGGNANDTKAMQKVADDVIRIRNATGKSATEALETLNKLFSSANTDFKKKLLQGGGVSLAAAGLLGGQGSTAFLERFMGMSQQARSGLEAQGMGRLIGSGGQLNAGAFQSTVAEAKSRGSGNAEFGLQTMGMTEDEAKGFLRLAEALKTNGDAINGATKSVVDINDEYRKTMGLGDAFRANLNKVKGGFTEFMDKIHAPDLINGLNNTLGDASQSSGGAAAVVGGSAILAAILTSKGLGGVGGLITGEAKKKAIESVTGENVQRVEVINWPAGFSAGGGMDIASKAVKAAALTTAGVVGIGAVATAAGALTVAPHFAKEFEKNKNTMADIPASERGAAAGGTALAQTLIAWLQGNKHGKDVRVTVDSKDKSLKAFQSGSRGASQ